MMDDIRLRAMAKELAEHINILVGLNDREFTPILNAIEEVFRAVAIAQQKSDAPYMQHTQRCDARYNDDSPSDRDCSCGFNIIKESK